jgi:hypothetical protein
MQPALEAPTPKALADLVARCKQINRFETQLTVAEEIHVATLASSILVMRQVLDLEQIDPDKLPARQGRIRHWALTGRHLKAVETPAIHALHGALALDEHEQLKVLSHRSWRGHWRSVVLWRSAAHGLHAAPVMEYLARLAALAQERAPDVAHSLLARSEALEWARDLTLSGPRARIPADARADRSPVDSPLAARPPSASRSAPTAHPS